MFNLFICRLEIKDFVLKEIFGGEVERLTGGLWKLHWVLGECDFWCM